MVSKTKKQTVRLNLEVSPSVRERLERLRDLSDAESLTEVVRRSLAVYELLLVATIERQAELVLRDSEGEKPVLLVP